MNGTAPTKRGVWASRAGRVLGAVVAATVLGGCSDLLTVNNPGAIVEDDLNDPAMIPMIVHGVIGEFQPGFTHYALYTGTFSDELNDVHSWRENPEIDLRATGDNNGLISGSIYVPLQRARAAGDEGAELLRGLLGDKAGESLDVARVLAYSGYSLVLLGEGFCSAPIDVSVAHPPAKLFDMAIERFEEVIAVASAAKQAGAKAASADSLINLARVGAARAALGQNAKSKALEYAEEVPEGFLFWVTHSSNSTRQYNPFWDATRLAAPPNIALEPSFEGLDDRRIPHRAEKDTLSTLFRTGFVPLTPSSYQGWDPENPEPISQATGVRLASGLEARYIVAEADGMTEAELLDFINERRAVGGQGALTTAAGVDLKAELRDQRRRDLFIDGHRLGDLRRYKATGVGDFFPTGDWPYSTSTPAQQYGTMECFDIPIAEKNSNPNLK
jgi:hypothetical protein